MSFDADWLLLREPADRAARDVRLVAAFARHLSSGPKPLILDIGCGTGSTLRSLEDAVPVAAQWMLLDYDPLLLEAARQQNGAGDHVTYRQHDLNDLDGLPVDYAAMVTASALFDLCSYDFSSAFAERLATNGTGLYAALNYDGNIQWSKTHRLDDTVIAAFNRHQQTDKGFGVALGPDAARRLAELLENLGFTVQTGESPWRLGPERAALQQAFIAGFRQPLHEIGGLTSAEIDDWIAFRLSAIETAEGDCTVGHTDVLALPASR